MGLFSRSSDVSTETVNTDKKSSRTRRGAQETPSSSSLDALQYQDIIDLDLFEQDLDMWFAKATLMHAIATFMIREEVDPSVDRSSFDVEDTLKNLVFAYDRRDSSSSVSAPQVPFKKTRLFRELRAIRSRSSVAEHDKTVQDLVHHIRADQLADGITELSAEPSTPSRTRASKTLSPDPYTPPASTNAPRREVSREGDSTAPSSSQHSQRMSQQAASTPSPTPLYPSPWAMRGRAEGTPSPLPVSQWIDATPGPNDDYPLCTVCNNRCVKLPTKSGPNEGRMYFKCLTDTCRPHNWSWRGWSQPAESSATENRCFCGIPGAGFKGSDGVFRYRCSRGSRGCANWAYYP